MRFPDTPERITADTKDVFASSRCALTAFCLATGATAQAHFTVGFEADQAQSCASLQEAVDAARAQRAADARAGAALSAILIELGPGTLELERSVVIEAALSGSATAPTVLRGHGSRLVGGRQLDAELVAGQRPPAALRARLPSADARAAVRWIDAEALGIGQLGPIVPRGMPRPVMPAPSEVFWNGRPLELARWPQRGFATVDEVLDRGSVPREHLPDLAGDGAAEPARGGRFVVRNRRVESWQARGAWLHGYWAHDWADELLPIASISALDRSITLALPHHYGIGPAARFRAVNMLEELDRPGEAWLDEDRNGYLFWPPDDQGDADLIVTTLAEPLLDVIGAEHVLIQGIAFGPTRGCALRVDGGSAVTIDECTVRGAGAQGFVLRGLRHRVSRCTLLDCGAAGITLDGGDRASLTPAGHVVEHCELARFGRLERCYRPGIEIAGVGQQVRHNLLHDAPHAALLISGNEHLIEANEIHHVLQETGDAGAIYAGRDWAMHGTVIRHNLIRDLPGTPSGLQNAIYLDDMASGITVEGNVLLRCKLGMLLGGGRALRIAHNVFVDCDEGLRFDARGVGWMAKQIADPATSTLHLRLAALPIDRPPWSLRYPEVQQTLTRAFGRPAGSAVLANAFVRTPFGKVEDPDQVTVAGNRSLASGLEPDDFEWSAAARLDLRELPGFPPIPLGAVGPAPPR